MMELEASRGRESMPTRSMQSIKRGLFDASILATMHLFLLRVAIRCTAVDLASKPRSRDRVDGRPCVL